MSYLNTSILSLFNRCLSTKTSVLRVMDKYDEAIIALNSLQSNAAYIRSRSYQKSSYEEDFNRTIVHTKKLLAKIGINKNDLNKLSIIHVAGTKGKGFTCAYTESILRHHGFKTGFYSSPHLMEVRERIRINGVPLSHEKFTQYFWKIYSILNTPQNVPLAYFRFLTIMAFEVFLKEQVDVAIMEVGIGGEFDTTNVVSNVPVVGITSLGIDHTNLLGETIEEIAWHKAGIIKKNSNVFTVPQLINAINILMERSKERGAGSFKIIEPFLKESNLLNAYPDVINLNASLAVVLSHSWIQQNQGNKMDLDEFASSCSTVKGLAQTSWPGRYQIFKKNKSTLFLDGAHTAESMLICKKWFESKSFKSHREKALIFNMIGQRDIEKLLGILITIDFDVVIFVPNISGISHSPNNYVSPSSYYADKCQQNKEAWLKLLENNNKKIIESNVLIMPNVLNALNYISLFEYDCLVTGSLHLMGAALEVLDPELKH
ncbi:folylpolyglutamate synthase, mitochondrial [Onthophagus taurus]|uniref:folylpolyglutamate synthase, mitochondrial n=1 Tax=Onthophagus taurus TaxID=166361 RepID=UPI0039BDEF4F